MQISVGWSELGRVQEEMLDCADLWCKDGKLGRNQEIRAHGQINLGQAETVKGEFSKK